MSVVKRPKGRRVKDPDGWQPHEVVRFLSAVRHHDQRYTYITTARDKGTNLEVLANWVGQDLKITADIYSHVIELRQRRAARTGQKLYAEEKI
jgi:hypothetical protein